MKGIIIVININQSHFLIINYSCRPTFAQVADSLNQILTPIKSKSRTLKFGRADTGLQFEHDDRYTF